MNKKIEKFDKEHLELLLKDLQDIDNFTEFKDGAFKYGLGKYQANLLVNFIKKQKEVIDNAIEYVEHRIVEDDYMLSVDTNMVQKELLDILNEVSE